MFLGTGSLVVENLSAQFALSNDTGIVFAYCNYKEPQEAATYLKVFIKQLSRRMSELPVELEKLYDKHHSNASNLGLTELLNTFIAVSGCFHKVFVVLDALDESTEDQKSDLFKALRGIGEADGANTKLFVTSRKEPDIQRAFGGFPVIEIEAKKVDADIESYVTAQLDQHLRDGILTINGTSLKDKIPTALLSRARGMYVSLYLSFLYCIKIESLILCTLTNQIRFLWVEFQLKHLCS